MKESGPACRIFSCRSRAANITACFMEMKFGKNKPKTDQFKWMDALRVQGYYVRLAWDWQTAAEIITRYLGDGKERKINFLLNRFAGNRLPWYSNSSCQFDRCGLW